MPESRSKLYGCTRFPCERAPVKQAVRATGALRGFTAACALACLLHVPGAHAGYREGVEAFAANDYARALAEFKAGAENGNAEAQYRYGDMLVFGVGRSGADIRREDVERGVAWIRKSAEGGSPGGRARLGELYLTGRGVAKDVEQAVKWLAAAASGGHGRSATALGLLYLEGVAVPKNDVTAVKWFEAGAELQEPRAQYQLSSMLARGTGVARSARRARELLIKSARGGYPLAQFTLGRMLADATGMFNRSESIRLLRAAVAARVPGAEAVLTDLSALEVSGETLTSFALQAHALAKDAALFAKRLGCTAPGSIKVVSAEIPGRPDIRQDSFVLISGEWVEHWEIAGCGRTASVELRFKADGKGGASYRVSGE